MQSEKRSKSKPPLKDTEKYICRLQNRLIDFRGDLSKYTNDPVVNDYARHLAAYYFPKRAGNEVYLQSVVDSYVVDLLTASRLHNYPYLWRSNYDDLDLLSNFYNFSHRRNGYFHASYGRLLPVSRQEFECGLDILGIELGDYTERIWNASLLPGKRSSIARRIVDNIGHLDFDEMMNREFWFAENISSRNRHKAEGKGKFRYLRRGLDWLLLGTAKRGDSTVDLRETVISELWGYQIRYDKREQKIRIAVSARNLKNCKSQLLAVLESGLSAPVKLKKVSDYYRHFYEQHRFANNTRWSDLNIWLLRRTRNLRRSLGKENWKMYLAHLERAEKSTYLPRRCNFFWNVEKELHCDYRLIWNPYRFLNE